MILKKSLFGTSLLVQWLRIHLPKQGTQVQFLVQEDSACLSATKPLHSYWAHTLETTGCDYWDLCSLGPALHSKRSQHNAMKSSPYLSQLEKALTQPPEPKNWCFWTMVLEKTLESPLDCKEIQTVYPKGNQSWIFIGRTDAEAETPILWPPDVKN